MATNEAYDLSMFEQRKKKERTLQKLPAVQPKSGLKATLALAGKLMVALIVGIVVSVGIYSRVILTETVSGITEAKSTLTKLQSEQTRLSMELDKKVSVKAIEDYATNQLGLSRMDKYQITYVALAGDDQIEQAAKKEAKKPFSLTVNDLFYQLVEYIN